MVRHYSSKKNMSSYIDLLSLEVDIEGYLKRKLGYSEWDKKWDLGIYRENDKNYIILSRKNDLGNFEALEKVELTDELKPVEWLNIALRKYLNI
jgi:hypothetical protein